MTTTQDIRDLFAYHGPNVFQLVQGYIQSLVNGLLSSVMRQDMIINQDIKGPFINYEGGGVRSSFFGVFLYGGHFFLGIPVVE